MIAEWLVLFVTSGYLILLLVLSRGLGGEKHAMLLGSTRATIYALSFGIYATAWAFYGSISMTSWSGLDFSAIFLGPILFVSLGNSLLRRIIRIAKTQNVTSLADFISARYGKSVPIAALVSTITFIGAIPYIGMQLMMVASSYNTLVADKTAFPTIVTSPFSSIGHLAGTAIIIAVITLLMSHKKNDQTTESRDGLLVVVALNSVVKLLAFLMVGIYATYFIFDGFGSVFLAADRLGLNASLMDKTSSFPDYIALLVLSTFAALLQPRQFHMAVVENRDVNDLRRAAWLIPAYFTLLAIFIVPITLVSLVTYGYPSVYGSMAMITLPLDRGNNVIALTAFIGGLSAATVMIVVEVIALSIMMSNHIIMPLLLRVPILSGSPHQHSLTNLVRITRYSAIILIIGLAFLFQLQPLNIPLPRATYLAFGAFAQIAPAFFIGLFWTRATALGAICGMIVGCLVSAYTLLLPDLITETSPWHFIATEGPFGIGFLRPSDLFNLGLSPLFNGVLFSLTANTLCCLLFSFIRVPQPLEKIQANAFIGVNEASSSLSFRFFRATVTVGELRNAVARYLGQERTDRSFRSFALSRNLVLNDREEADLYLLRFAEHLLASIIGAASSRLALSLVLRRRTVSTDAALKLLDDASAAIQYSRDLLQYAVDHARQGITVFDKDLMVLTWNHAFVELYDLPPGMMHVGISLDEIVRYNAMRGSYGSGDVEELVTRRLRSFVYDTEPVRLRLFPGQNVLEIRTSQLPEGGYVTTYTDVTEAVAQEEERKRANETLELRVQERTEELTRLNTQLTQAKAEADEANLSKTRFLAAAGHDILQPLNAARLYSTSLIERVKGGEVGTLAENVNASLDAVEEILTALLDISRLDTGAMRPQFSDFRIEDIMVQLKREFDPIAEEKGLKLKFVISSLTIHSDRRLLRRLLQNLVSNAIKYTPSGGVLVGAKRRNGKISLEVWDTGLGISESQKKMVFHEFKRLEQGAKIARGLGLGLSIVERISKVLEHRVDLFSKPGQGSVFRVEVPISKNMPVIEQQEEVRRIPATPLSGMRILAIDNEPIILEGMQVLLQGWGCRVLKATGVEAARELILLDPSAIDVVIADYHLDDGDGLQAIAAVREIAHEELLAVLITADRSPAVREMTAAANAHLLNKPLKPAALRALLGQWRLMQITVDD